MKFPMPPVIKEDFTLYARHATLRDYFAAKAMQAYITAWSINKEHPLLDETTAQSAYMAADAMLKAREE